MGVFDKLNDAVNVIQSAKSKLAGGEDNGGGLGNWLKDKAGSGIDIVTGAIPDIDIKGVITDTVTYTAEAIASGYDKLENLAENHPRVAGVLEGGSNFFIDRLAGVAEHGIDKNPETLGWEDLGAIWLLEVDDVGENGVIVFDENARTTQDLMTQEGVQDARDKVMDAIASGDYQNENTGNDSWTYGVEGYYQSLQEQNGATIFLGSYSTQYEISENPDGTFTVNYTVNNTSGLESGTRFRVDNDGDGVHDGIIPNKDVGDGLHLGGTVSQRWEWSETITQEELENFQN